VRRIFAEYLEGRSPLAIARRLNAEGVPSPRGGEWRQNAIMGHRRRRNGILCNDLYAGRIVYNRQRMVRDPVSRRRVSRPNPVDHWVTMDVPELRIVDAEIFDQVQRRLMANEGKPAHVQRRPRRLFSGLLACGECGGPMTIVSADRWGCATRKEKGSCGNGRTIVNAQLEKRLLGALREQMLAPDLVRAYVLEYHQRRRKNAQAARSARGSIEARIAALDGKLTRIAAAYADGEVPLEELRAIATPAKEERDGLRLQLLDIESEEVIALEPAVELKYRTAIDGLAGALEGDNLNRQEAKAGIRALIDVVVVHPRADGRGVELELRGRLAELLALTQKKPAPSREPAFDCTARLVAGARISRWSAISTAWC
jgi:site-specific DNA recombinase